MPGRTASEQRALRILVVAHALEPGGTERVALRLAGQWAADGQQVALACGRAEGPLRRHLSDDVELFAPSSPPSRWRHSRLATALFAAQAARAFRPDAIFLPGNYHAGMAIVLRLKLGRLCPAIVLKLSNALRRPRRWPWSHALYLARLAAKTAFADRLIAMSPELLVEARRSLPWPAGKYRVIAEPVLESRRAPRPQTRSPDEHPALLVAAGRLAPQKNFSLLLDAASRIDRRFTLAIFGDGPERIALEERARALGLAQRVKFMGYVDDIQPALSAARLFILSSDYEGLPAVLIEALGAGVPVVATDCSPAIAGIVALSDGGIPVPPRDARALANAITEALDRPRPDREALAASVNRYRIGPSATAYLDMFRALAGKSWRP